MSAARGVHGWVDNDIHPATFGLTVRVSHMYRGLARRRPVSVTCAVPRRNRRAPRETVDGVRLTRIKPYHPAAFHYLEQLRLAPLFLAHDAYRLWPKRLLETADPAASIWQFDSLSLCGLADFAPDAVRTVYASQNVETEWFDRVGPRLVGRAHWAEKLHAIEKHAVTTTDMVVAVSAEDRQGFIRRYGVPGERVVVVENGYDARTLRPPTPAERAAARQELELDGERALLFMGSDFAHNRDAVEDLLRWLAPHLAELGAVLLVAGSVAERYAESAAASGGRVRCLAPRPDPRPYLWGADVGLNPVRRGAGSNVKLPTYLGAGLPVLSTRFGTRGYEPLVPFVTIAESEELVAVLRRGEPGPVAPDTPLAPYAWDHLADKLADAYDRLESAAAHAGGTPCAS